MNAMYPAPKTPAHATHRSAMLANLFKPVAVNPELEALVRRIVREEIAAGAPGKAAPQVAYRPTIALCIELAATAFKVPVDQILSKSRHRHRVEARHAAMWLADRVTGKSYPVIGRAFGRDHSSVIHGVKRANEMRASDKAFADLTTGLLANFQRVV